MEAELDLPTILVHLGMSPCMNRDVKMQWESSSGNGEKGLYWDYTTVSGRRRRVSFLLFGFIGYKTIHNTFAGTFRFLLLDSTKSKARISYFLSIFF